MTEFLSPLLAQQSGSNPLTLLFLPVMLGLLFFVMIRPQRKRQKEMQKLQSEIGVGDEVITTSGIYGFITGEEDELFWLEIDNDVQIRIAKAAIHARVPDPAASAADDNSASKTEKPAKADRTEHADQGDDS